MYICAKKKKQKSTFQCVSIKNSKKTTFIDVGLKYIEMIVNYQ